MNKFSAYLKKKKPLVKELVNLLSSKYEYVSVLGTDVKGKQYLVSNSNVSINPVNISECGFVLRVFKDGVYSEHSFNELTKSNLSSIIDKIDYLANSTITVDKIGCKKIQEEELTKKFMRKQKGVEYTDDEILDKLKELLNYGLSLDEKVFFGNISVEYKEYSKMFISTKKDLEQYYTWINPRCAFMARNSETMKLAYDGTGTNDNDKTFDLLKESVESATKLSVELLSATTPEPGMYTVVTDPSITGLIAHEAFGHGLEMDQFVKERAKSVEYMNKPVASKILSMHDGAKASLSAASYFFDDEGVLAQDTKTINKGTLIGGICDSVSASILGYNPTGNGRRESYKRKVYTRMTNTFFEKGSSTLDEMIKSVDYGYYIAVTNNGMEDPKNWGIQCTAHYGREIKDGKFTGKIVSPVVMSGYVIDLLMNISMISKDNFEVIGSGSCGKGYKEWVRVSDGGASIKTKVKIG